MMHLKWGDFDNQKLLAQSKLLSIAHISKPILYIKITSDNKPLVIFMAEAVGFEPTGDFTRHSISSRDRYDHFDTPPYAIVRPT